MTSAAAAALARSAAEAGCEPVSGAVGDDEHEPRSASGATQPLSRHPAHTDTATSNTTSHHAAAAAEAVMAGMAAEEAVSRHRQGMSGSLSRERTPQHEDVAAGAEAAEAVAGDASVALSPIEQRHRQEPSDMPPSNGQEQQGRAGSEQPEQAGDEQGTGAMQVEGPVVGEGEALAADTTGSGGAAFLAAQAVPVKTEAHRTQLSGAGNVLGSLNIVVQQQPSKAQEKQQQQQQSPGSKSRQQLMELDLGDVGAQPDAAAQAARPLLQQQQAGKDKPVTPADLQAALFSAAAAAGQGMASSAAAAPVVHRSTAVSPYVPGMSAAAAAALTGGLNLADSPQLGAAVSQEEPHPGAQLPEAAAAALAATLAAGGLLPTSGMVGEVAWSVSVRTLTAGWTLAVGRISCKHGEVDIGPSNGTAC